MITNASSDMECLVQS